MSTMLRILGSLLALVVLGGAVTFPLWRGMLFKAADDVEEHADHEPPERVKLSPQARANLKLQVGKIALVTEPYWRHIQVPGWVVERQGSCERLVSAPVAGVVKHVAAVRGDLLRPGSALFTLQIVSEPLLSAQANLLKTLRELQIAQEEKKRLTQPLESGAIPMARMIEVENQIKLLNVTLRNLDQELALRGLSKSDIEQVAQGKFVRETTVPVPPFAGDVHSSLDGSQPPEGLAHEHQYELEELKVMLGETVQAGAPLCVLADHHHLQIEGRVFASEAELIQAAARQGVAIRAEFSGNSPVTTAAPPKPPLAKGGLAKEGPVDVLLWPSFKEGLKIANIANRIDPNHQTLNFFLPLPNDFKAYPSNGKTYRLWRFRPGQRVQLKVPVEAFTEVFVLPAEAVAREGPERFVFRENGEFFERRPVHVRYEDRQVAVIAHDGSLFPGNVIALNAAVQINWALKAQAEGEGGHHHHHDH